MFSKKGTDPFYNSKRWRRLRESILRRDGYMDQLDLRMGEHVEAETVHHIFPRDKYPQYKWAAWNLISLSAKNHELMHVRATGELSDLGRQLLNETARARGIKTARVTLVVGLPGSGKTTWTRRALGGGLAFDLDHLAGALRLRMPHAEYHDAARRMAASLCRGFAGAAARYTGDVYVIRSAPDVDEAAELEPDRIVLCEGRHDITTRGDYRREDLNAMCENLDALAEWADANGVEFLRYET